MAASIWEHFSVIPDPRVDRTKLHKLEDILVIVLCAVISGAETWVGESGDAILNAEPK